MVLLLVCRALEQCVHDVQVWCSSRRLQLNPAKTELIWFGSQLNLEWIPNSDVSVRVSESVIQATNRVRDLGIILDSLFMCQHIAKVTSTCFFHLRQLRKIGKILDKDSQNSLVCSFILTRIDHSTCCMPNRLLQCRTAWFHSSTFTTCFSRCCLFCHWSVTTRPHHSSSDGTTLAACAYHVQTMYPDAGSRVRTRPTVLDGHGGVCVTTYRQVLSTFSSNGGFRYTAHLHYLQIDIVFCRSSTDCIFLLDCLGLLLIITSVLLS